MSIEQAPPIMEKPGSPRQQGRLAQGCLILFGLPFAGFGIFAIVMAVRQLNEGKSKEAAMMGLFGLVFTGVGGALMIGSIFGGRKIQQQAERQAAAPDQPWLWREDWARGESLSAGGRGVATLWFFAVFWNAVSSFVWFVIPQEVTKGNKVALVAFLFPLIGIGLIASAIRSTLAQRRFGQTRFKFTTVPAMPGGYLLGNIEVNTRLQPEIGVVLHLRCIRRTTKRSGKKSSTSESTIWEDEKILGPKLPGHVGNGTRIPVFFRIPADALESDAAQSSNNGIFWRLRATASVPGIDFDAEYPVPVFKNSAATLEEIPDPTVQYQLPVEKLRAARRSRIRVTDLPGGASEFIFPAARNPGAALFVTLFAVIFNGVATGLGVFKGMILLPAIFGLFGLLATWWAANLWFKSSRITISPSGVTLRNRWLLFTKTRQFGADEISRIISKVGMTSGSQAFHDIKLVTRDQEDRANRFAELKERYQQTGDRPPLKFGAHDPSGFTLAAGLASKVETDWLIREMEEALLK